MPISAGNCSKHSFLGSLVDDDGRRVWGKGLTKLVDQLYISV